MLVREIGALRLSNSAASRPSLSWSGSSRFPFPDGIDLPVDHGAARRARRTDTKGAPLGAPSLTSPSVIQAVPSSPGRLDSVGYGSVGPFVGQVSLLVGFPVSLWICRFPWTRLPPSLIVAGPTNTQVPPEEHCASLVHAVGSQFEQWPFVVEMIRSIGIVQPISLAILTALSYVWSAGIQILILYTSSRAPVFLPPPGSPRSSNSTRNATFHCRRPSVRIPEANAREARHIIGRRSRLRSFHAALTIRTGVIDVAVVPRRPGGGVALTHVARGTLARIADLADRKHRVSVDVQAAADHAVVLRGMEASPLLVPHVSPLALDAPEIVDVAATDHVRSAHLAAERGLDRFGRRSAVRQAGRAAHRGRVGAGRRSRPMCRRTPYRPRTSLSSSAR